MAPPRHHVAPGWNGVKNEQYSLGPGLTDLIRDQDTLDMSGTVLINASVGMPFSIGRSRGGACTTPPAQAHRHF